MPKLFHLPLIALFATSTFFGTNFASVDDLTEDMRKVQIGWVISALIMNSATILAGKGVFSELPNASPAVEGFVQEIGADHGLPNDYEIKIGNGYAAGIGTIVLEHDQNSSYSNVSTIDSAIEKYSNATTEEELVAAKEKLHEDMGSLDHEFTHYKNHDLRNSLFFSSAFSIGALVSYLIFENNYLSENLRKSSTLKKWLYAYASGLGLSSISTLVNFWNKRRIEQRADEGVRNEAHILKAMIKWTQRDQRKAKDMLNASNSWLGKKIASLLDTYPSLYLLLDPSHPPLPSREARFKERLAALESLSAESQ